MRCFKTQELSTYFQFELIATGRRNATPCQAMVHGELEHLAQPQHQRWWLCRGQHVCSTYHPCPHTDMKALFSRSCAPPKYMGSAAVSGGMCVASAFNTRRYNIAPCIHHMNGFQCHNNLLWDMALNVSRAVLRGGWIQLVSYQSLPPPRGCNHQCKGDSLHSRCARLAGTQLGAAGWTSPHPHVWTRVEIH